MKCFAITILVFILPCEPAGSADVVDPNVFAHTFNSWAAHLPPHPVPNLDAREIRDWLEVKHQWKVFQKAVDDHYLSEGYEP